MTGVTLILGAGLTGLSCSYHIGHHRCLLLEKSDRPFGHISSEHREGFTWDSGPHVSFTKHEYVRDLFETSVGGEFDEYEVTTSNYYRGNWIDHPAQSSLHQVPEPLRSQCLQSFLDTRAKEPDDNRPTNYMEWLERAFGPVFARTFPAAYTRKYWTRDPSELTTDWVGQRVFYPAVEDVIAGSKGPLGRPTHYISKVRYPRKGGYQAFAAKLAEGSSIRYGSEVGRIDLKNRVVTLLDGTRHAYHRLINTIPLPVFINACEQVPASVCEAASALSCSQLLLVNVAAKQATARRENWMYVYDEDKCSTRIHCTEKLTKGNAPTGWSGIQAEVYFSRHRPLPAQPGEVASQVQRELAEMGLIDQGAIDAGETHQHSRYSQWANVIFDHGTRPALDRIWSWLESQGLKREEDDLDPTTDHDRKVSEKSGVLVMAGRFGQWKYFWTDDCIMRGQYLSRAQR